MSSIMNMDYLTVKLLYLYEIENDIPVFAQYTWSVYYSYKKSK